MEEEHIKDGHSTAQLLIWIRIFCFFFSTFWGRTGTTVYAIKALSNIPLLLTAKNFGLLSKLLITIYMWEGCQSVNESILQCRVTNEVTIEDD